jgi:hypothetical protein
MLENGIFCIEEILDGVYRERDGDPVFSGGIRQFSCGDAVGEKPVVDKV